MNVIIQLRPLAFLLLQFFACVALADTFSDNFDVQSYSNQNGSHSWSTDWNETGDNDNSGSGDIEITGGELHLQDNNNSISRQLDLSGYVSATLAFDFRESSLDSAADYVNLEIRTGGGAWTELQRFQGPTNTSDSVNIDISLYLANDTEIRFDTAANLSNFDDFYVDNLVIDAIAANPTATYLDLFSVVSYGNQDGLLNWAADWDETGDDDSPSGGDIDIVGNQLHLQDGSVSILRRVDLSSASSATLSFDYREDSLDNANEYVDLEIRMGGGAWIFLQRFVGPANEGGTYSADISAYMAADTEIRFVTASTTSMNNNDDFYVDNFAVNALTIPSPVGYWHLDETVWDGSSNQIEDVSGNNLHGISVAVSGTHPSPDLVNPAIADPNGTCGYGEFDGANRGYLEVADPGLNWELDLPDELTVSVWIQPRSIPSSELMTIVSKDDNFEFHINSSGQINWWWGGGARELTTTGTALVADGTWHHIAITYESGTQKIYIDGIERASGTTTGTLTLNNHSLYIGTDFAFNSRTFDGFIDEVQIFDSALSQAQVQGVMAQTHACANLVVAHYGVSYDSGVSYNDSTAVTCEAASVTIIAHGPGHVEPVSPGAGTSITLSTSTNDGFWSSPSVGSLVDSGNGNAVYTFAGNGQVTLQFNHTVEAINPTPVNIHVNAGSPNPTEDAGEDPDIQFFETGFRFVDGSDNPIIANLTSAQTSANYALQAIRTDTQTGECVGIFANGASVDVELAAECNDPISCAGLNLSLTNNSVTTVLATNNDNGSSGAAAYTTFSNLLFGADSKADFTFNYPDVGSLSLHARFEIPNNGGSSSGDFMLGSSNNFVVRPADLVITAVDDGVTGNPGTTSAGTGFVVAGDSFRVFVEAHNALGVVTPNFGNEISPEGLNLQVASVFFPAGGDNGVIGNPATFAATGTAGEFLNSNLSWSEVGTIQAFINIADGDYLGSGDVVGTTSANIGRFYPADFLLQSSAVDNGCAAGSFSYLSDPSIDVAYQIVARNRGGIPTINYDNVDFTYPAATVSVHGEDNNDGNDLATRISVASGLWDDGVMSVADNSAFVSRAVDLSLNTIPDGPFSNFAVGLQINDIDTVNFSSLDFKPSDNNNCLVDGDCDSRLLGGSLNLRFGRLRLSDVHGPESADIPMVWQSEYWNNSGFVLNSNDHCTQLPLTAITFVGATNIVNDANDTITTTIGGASSVFNFSDPIGASNCLTISAIGLCDGRAGLAYGAPNAVVTYPIDVDLSGLPFLQGDWNQDGNYNDSTHPRTYVRFQHYRGHDRVIYWRERLQ